MSAANQPYTEAQKAMMEKFNAHIREGSSSFAAPTGCAALPGIWKAMAKALRDSAARMDKTSNTLGRTIARAETYEFCAREIEIAMAQHNKVVR